MAKQNTQFLNWFGPLLEALRDLGDTGRPREVSAQIAKNLDLGDEVLDQTLKSGGNRFHNQVAWARQYLVWEGHLDSSKHGTWTLTDKGRSAKLDYNDASEIFKKWTAYHSNLRKEKSKSEDVDGNEDIETKEINEEIELISVLRGLSPEGFEKVCRELLRESGFENVEVTGGSADDGIDGYGTLELNPFVSFKVMFQCKRYKEGNSVSRPQVGDFRNAMIGRAEKGIIITTSSFTSSAIKEATRDGAPPIELIDGVKLVEMFQKVELGLKPRTVFDVDITYFEKFQK
ncbi:MAG: restriction endonuclease [Saprospiraceae bacterium]